MRFGKAGKTHRARDGHVDGEAQVELRTSPNFMATDALYRAVVWRGPKVKDTKPGPISEELF